MKRLDLRSRHHTRASRVRTRRKTRRIFRLGVLGCLVVGLLGGLWFLLRIERLTVSAVEFEGNGAVSTSALESSIEEALSGSYYFIIPRRNIFFYPEKKIEQTLLSTYPILSRAEVTLRNFKVLHVTLTERSPKGLWCASRGGPCYFIDREGVIFSKAPEFSGDVYVTYYGGGIEEPLGAFFLPPVEFYSLETFLGKLPALSFTPQSITHNEDGTFTVEVKEGGEIRFPEASDFSATFENLSTAVASPDFKKKSRSTLLYIDLRFENKVFYRFLE